VHIPAWLLWSQYFNNLPGLQGLAAVDSRCGKGRRNSRLAVVAGAEGGGAGRIAVGNHTAVDGGAECQGLAGLQQGVGGQGSAEDGSESEKSHVDKRATTADMCAENVLSGCGVLDVETGANQEGKGNISTCTGSDTTYMLFGVRTKSA
jgi:hypothetical protein